MKFRGSIPSLSLDEKGQGSVHFFQGSSSRCASFKFFSNSGIANFAGLSAAEVGFLVVKPVKKHTFLASGINGGQTGNAPISGWFYKILCLVQVPFGFCILRSGVFTLSGVDF